MVVISTEAPVAASKSATTFSPTVVEFWEAQIVSSTPSSRVVSAGQAAGPDAGAPPPAPGSLHAASSAHSAAAAAAFQ
jgi:hypothetical protein